VLITSTSATGSTPAPIAAWNRLGGDQAQVGAAGGGAAGFGFELLANLVKVDLAGAEGHSGAPGSEGHHRHTQDLAVELRGGADVGDGQHQMVQPVDVHGATVISRPTARRTVISARAVFAGLRLHRHRAGFRVRLVRRHFGPDLVRRDDMWMAMRHESTDPAVKRADDLHFAALIKNTYKVLLTRGMRATALYSTDAETQAFFEEMTR
jgi:hypothetical protein